MLRRVRGQLLPDHDDLLVAHGPGHPERPVRAVPGDTEAVSMERPRRHPSDRPRNALSAEPRGTVSCRICSHRVNTWRNVSWAQHLWLYPGAEEDYYTGTQGCQTRRWLNAC